jgi:putative hydrolase of the HAD superfamily
VWFSVEWPVQPVRVVLFDADGVIQHVRHSSGNGLRAQVERILGFLPADFDRFTQDIFDAEQSALVGQTDFAEVLVPVLAKWGAHGVADALAAEWWCPIEADRSILDLVGQLRRQGMLCALATNQQRYRATYMEEALSYKSVFDRSFYSYQLGLRKPAIEYFEAIVAELECSPEEMLFIDDAERNVAVARSVGLRAEQFIHPRTNRARASLIELLEQFSVVITGQDS